MSRIPPIARLLAASAMAALVLTAGSADAAPKKKASKPTLEGYWETPAGQVKLERKGDAVRGVLSAPAKGIGLDPGTPVFEGTFYEDSLSGDARVVIVQPACGAEPSKAFVTLLLTRSGRLTGGASSKAPCAKDLPPVRWLKADGPRGASAMKAPSAVPEGTYDPRGHRKAELPKGVRAVMKEGEQALITGRFEEARKLFLQAIKLDPKVGEAYNGVGVTFYARNDYDSAIDWYKQGLEAAPGFADLYYNLACAYALRGKTSMALRYLKLAASKGYVEVEALDKDPDLESLRSEPDFVLIRGMMETPAPPMPE